MNEISELACVHGTFAYNIIWGYAALDKKELFDEASLLYSNLEFWGWFLIVVGAPTGRARRYERHDRLDLCDAEQLLADASRTVLFINDQRVGGDQTPGPQHSVGEPRLL